MKTKTFAVFLTLLFAAGAWVLSGQQSATDINGVITNRDKARIAVPDFRGSGDAQKFMKAFNDTLWNELDGSGALTMVAKSVYPLDVPQRPEDFKAPQNTIPVRKGEQSQTVRLGPWLTDWSGPPVNASHLAFGYTGVAPDGQLVLYGWLYNLSQATPAAAQLLAKVYFGPLNDTGARKVAREFAADILQQFGAKSLIGSRIFFVSDRSGHKEIWSMDYDGTNQRQMTNYKTITTQPALSGDGKMFAFTTYPQQVRDGHTYDGQPQIMVHSVETGRRLTFYNPPASSVVETPEFTPDGKRLMFATTIEKDPQICIADISGANMQRLSRVRAIEVSPRVNPKTGTDVLFISGRSGRQQLWRMNIDGSNPEMLTTGEGDVANPAWSPDGQFIAFSWTRGYEIGGFNIFIMDIAKRMPIQLTRGGGANENPWWAPDGVHLAFSAKRGRVTQIYTMLVDGTHVQPVTTQGNNLQPVWTKGIN